MAGVASACGARDHRGAGTADMDGDNIGEGRLLDVPSAGMETPHVTALVGAAPHGRGVVELAPPLPQAVRLWEQEELRELDFMGGTGESEKSGRGGRVMWAGRARAGL